MKAEAWAVVCSLSMNKALSLIPSTSFSPELCVWCQQTCCMCCVLYRSTMIHRERCDKWSHSTLFPQTLSFLTFHSFDIYGLFFFCSDIQCPLCYLYHPAFQMSGWDKRRNLSATHVPPLRQEWNWWTHERGRQHKLQPLSPINTRSFKGSPSRVTASWLM